MAKIGESWYPFSNRLRERMFCCRRRLPARQWPQSNAFGNGGGARPGPYESTDSCRRQSGRSQAQIHRLGGIPGTGIRASERREWHPGNGAQHRKGISAALHRVASRSLPTARPEQASWPSTGNNSHVCPRTLPGRDSRGDRRNSSVSRSPSAGSPSSSPGNSLPRSSEEFPAAHRCCNWTDACQPVNGKNIPSRASASHNDRQMGHDLRK